MVTRHRLKKAGAGSSKKTRLKREGFYIKIQEADGSETKKLFKSDKELKDSIQFDGQAFWLGSERLGEVEEELQWNWKKLTPKVIDEEKNLLVDYLKERD